MHSAVWTLSIMHYMHFMYYISNKRNVIFGREESKDSSNYIKLIPSVTSWINTVTGSLCTDIQLIIKPCRHWQLQRWSSTLPGVARKVTQLQRSCIWTITFSLPSSKQWVEASRLIMWFYLQCVQVIVNFLIVLFSQPNILICPQTGNEWVLKYFNKSS